MRPSRQTLYPVSPSEVGFDPDALAHVNKVMQRGLDTVFPAAVLLIARSSGIAMHRAYGYLDPETRQHPVQLDSLFDLASLTKLFTATAFMTLVEAGRVTLDTPVPEVLPEFDGVRPISPTQDPLTKEVVPADPAFAGMEVDARQVTFWHLLTHTSGLAAWRGLYLEESPGGQEVPLPHQVPADKRARRIGVIHARYGFAYPPGKRMVYSDLGLILLGEAIARLSGVSLDAYVRHSVLDPLGLPYATYNPLASGRCPLSDAASAWDPMRGTVPETLVPSEWCAWRRRRCVGEVHDENAASLGGVAGHAGLFATAREVAVLGQAYLNRGHYGTVRVLSPQAVAQMTDIHVNDADKLRPGDNPRGLAWMLRSQHGSSSGQRFGPHSYGHTGFTGTSLWVDPDRALVVALLTNRVYYGRDPTGITHLRPELHDAVIEAIRCKSSA
jgi:CubicO group peptidase (beta-lactamase class C family)